jgi:hypothetical protein
MTNGFSRVVPALIGLVAGFAVGWLVHQPAETFAGDQLIRVHGDGSVSKPEARLGPKDVAGWIADSGSLAILFPEKNFPSGISEPPFEGMIHQGTDWAVSCDNSSRGFCFSGKVNPKLPAGQQLRYKYDQVVGGNRTDGMIIITR